VIGKSAPTGADNYKNTPKCASDTNSFPTPNIGWIRPGPTPTAQTGHVGSIRDSCGNVVVSSSALGAASLSATCWLLLRSSLSLLDFWSNVAAAATMGKGGAFAVCSTADKPWSWHDDRALQDRPHVHNQGA
jgi:hypothetical protein